MEGIPLDLENSNFSKKANFEFLIQKVVYLEKLLMKVQSKLRCFQGLFEARKELMRKEEDVINSLMEDVSIASCSLTALPHSHSSLVDVDVITCTPSPPEDFKICNNSTHENDIRIDMQAVHEKTESKFHYPKSPIIFSSGSSGSGEIQKKNANDCIDVDETSMPCSSPLLITPDPMVDHSPLKRKVVKNLFPVSFPEPRKVSRSSSGWIKPKSKLSSTSTSNCPVSAFKSNPTSMNMFAVTAKRKPGPLEKKMKQTLTLVENCPRKPSPKESVDPTALNIFDGGERKSRVDRLHYDVVNSPGRTNRKRKSDEDLEHRQDSDEDRKTGNNKENDGELLQSLPDSGLNNSLEDLFAESELRDDISQPTNSIGQNLKSPKTEYSFNSTTNLAENFDKIPPRSPAKGFAFKPDRAIRNKKERFKLPGWVCDQCRGYYKDLEVSEAELQKILNKCSRHRSGFAVHQNDTPSGFWETDMPSTADCYANGIIAQGIRSPQQ